jgi:hypothetical protein
VFERKPEQYSQIVVGFDWVGDELRHPFFVFAHDNFLNFIVNAKKYNPRFGVRFHAGKGPIRPSTTDSATSKVCLAFYLHVYIVAEGICTFHSKLTESLVRPQISPLVTASHFCSVAPMTI